MGRVALAATPRNVADLPTFATPPAIEQALAPYDHASVAFQRLIQAIAESKSREDEQRSWLISRDASQRAATEAKRHRTRGEAHPRDLLRDVRRIHAVCHHPGDGPGAAPQPACQAGRVHGVCAAADGAIARADAVAAEHDTSGPGLARVGPRLSRADRADQARRQPPGRARRTATLSLLEAPTATTRVRVRAVGALMRCWAVAPPPWRPCPARRSRRACSPAERALAAARVGRGGPARHGGAPARPGVLAADLLAAQSSLPGSGRPGQISPRPGSRGWRSHPRGCSCSCAHRRRGQGEVGRGGAGPGHGGGRRGKLDETTGGCPGGGRRRWRREQRRGA